MSGARVWTIPLWGVVLIAACGGSSGGSPRSSAGVRCTGPLGTGNQLIGAESQNGTCGSPLMQLTGTKNSGVPCNMYTECAPTCCTCPMGSKVEWVAMCLNGVCASANDTCCEFEGDSQAQKDCL